MGPVLLKSGVEPKLKKAARVKPEISRDPRLWKPLSTSMGPVLLKSGAAPKLKKAARVKPKISRDLRLWKPLSTSWARSF